MPYANLYIWREKRRCTRPCDRCFCLQTVPKCGSAAIHCAGYRSDSRTLCSTRGNGLLSARFGISFFADEIRLEPIECPIAGCPWGDRFELGEVAHG
ncbi:hypothetical protein [Synechococcus sp. PCC 7335]|uniref:hypothetical protein n=1 Tax=Synechococcus sp. (strain ATCC 29403 / PCC 7335) TaxID=91464 RepID=UPI001D0D2619|nr:hypothetical protein [Synechococcus sp. PCC 7335]